MSGISVKIGNFLFRNVFPLYNVLYPVLKNRQDKREISLMKQYIKTGENVLDIGANIGFYTKILSKLVGNKGQVISFEPDSLNFRRLQHNCGKLQNVQLNNKAVSGETGVLRIYKSAMLNVDHRTYPVDDYESVEEIDCISPDTFLPENQRIDFIKIDIQGFEMSAFGGMKKILANNPDIKILSEFWPYGLSKAGHTTEEFLSFFWNAGFKVNLVKIEGFELLTPNNFKNYDIIDESIYMNIFVSRN
jgi:FkbM family methyltransferase